MVSTRHHPRPFPEPASPTGSSRSNTAEPVSKLSSSPPPSNSVSVSSRSTRKRRSDQSETAEVASTRSRHRFRHTVPPLLVIWLWVSLPLVLWDTGYIFCRPHSMPGGSLHWPLWKPYALYGTVDYVYGWPAWNGHVGFTAAQASLNVVETLMYIYYLVVVFKNGAPGVFGFGDFHGLLIGNRDKAIAGPRVAQAVLVLFSAAVMTLSKTVLYWLNEYFSDFANIGHNPLPDLILLWVIPNGLWLLFPIYIIYVLGKEMLEGLDSVASEKEE